MSRTSNALNRARQPFGASLWSHFWGRAKSDRRTMYRRGIKIVVTSDSFGGLCDHLRQPSLEDCGWGVQLETLVLRQNNADGSAWEVVENYLESGEQVLAVLKDWADLEELDDALDERLANELKIFQDERDYPLASGSCRTCGKELSQAGTLCTVCKEINKLAMEEQLIELFDGDDEDDDDSWF